MKVTLLHCTDNAPALLIFSKNTRLGLSAARFSEILRRCTTAHLYPSAHPEDAAWMEEELRYIANTIPSSWEFIDYTFIVEGVSRAYTHQQVRTRTGSYAQESLRVVNKDEFDYVFPQRPLPAQARQELGWALTAIRNTYASLVGMGVATEDARGILPTNIATNILVKFNLRTMAELAASRSGGRTQGEYREVVGAMCDAVLEVHPWAEQFLFPRERDYFAEIESFAEAEFGGDLLRKGRLLKIIDAMRKRSA